MRFLLDTHVFLWKLADSSRIPPKVLAETQDPKNDLFLSAVSLWEIAIRTRVGKLDLGGLSPKDLIDLASEMDIATIPLEAEEAVGYAELDGPDHSDPFDRMLVQQAISRRLTLVTADKNIAKFTRVGLKVLWK